MQVFGRLADGASWQDAASELDVGSARLAADQPAPHAQLRTAFAHSPGARLVIRLRLEDLAVHAIVLLLLGTVCANVATLTFARTAMRESEMVIRHALGGEPRTRGRADCHRRARAGPSRCRARPCRGPDDGAICLGPGESDQLGEALPFWWI